jgi:hypothetical protein
MEATPEEDADREQLDLFVPDLVTCQKHEQFLRRLFSCQAGTWLRVRELCAGLSEAEQFFRSLALQTESELVVLWLDHPTDPEYGYVHFYFPEFFWTSSAIYNRKVLNGV